MARRATSSFMVVPVAQSGQLVWEDSLQSCISPCLGLLRG